MWKAQLTKFDPIRNVTGLSSIRPFNEPAFEMLAQGYDSLADQGLNVKGAIHRIELVNRFQMLGMEGIASRAEEILNDMTVLNDILDSVEIAL